MAQEPFGDIPLFRELQKLLTSSEGPVNMELAGQAATAVASQTPLGAAGDPTITRSLRDAAHRWQELLSGYTRLSADEPFRIEVQDRRAWVQTTLQAWRWMIDQVAQRFGGQLATLAEDQPQNPMQLALGQVTPILMGLQTGMLVGRLAQEVIGRYDFPIARQDDLPLIFVWQNADRLAADYDFDHEELRRWLALHDGARHLVMTAVPWAHRYHKALLSDVVDSIEIDTSDLEKRLLEIQTQGIESLHESMGHQGLPLTPSERHATALHRLHAFIAVFEGYAQHAAGVIDTGAFERSARIDEGMARHRTSPSDSEVLLRSVLGVSIDRAMQASGRTFCAAVVDRRGISALNRLWEAPDNLPTLEEIKDPFAWMERALSQD